MPLLSRMCSVSSAHSAPPASLSTPTSLSRWGGGVLGPRGARPSGGWSPGFLCLPVCSQPSPAWPGPVRGDRPRRSCPHENSAEGGGGEMGRVRCHGVVSFRRPMGTRSSEKRGRSLLSSPPAGSQQWRRAASKTRLGAPPSPASQCQQAPGQSWEKPLWVPQALRGMWAGP